jgi:hypothetical protein
MRCSNAIDTQQTEINPVAVALGSWRPGAGLLPLERMYFGREETNARTAGAGRAGGDCTRTAAPTGNAAPRIACLG